VWNSPRLNSRIILSVILITSPLFASPTRTRGQSLTRSSQGIEAAKLALNRPVQNPFPVGESHSYLIDIQAGHYARVIIDYSAIGLSVIVYNPAGQPILEYECREYGPTPVSLIAETSGLYKLEARSTENEKAVGGYSVELAELRQATTKDEKRIAGERAFIEAEKLRLECRAESTRKAIRKYEETLLCWQAAGDKREEANALKSLGDVHQPLSEFKKALAYYERAFLMIKDSKDVRLEGEILNGLGCACLYLGENQKALDYCLKALNLSREANNKRGEIQALNNVGEAYYYFGSMQKSLEFHKQALSICYDTGDRRGLAQTALNLGYVYADLSDAQNAMDFYNRALIVWRATGNRRGEALTLIALGHLYSRLGEKQKALDIYSQAKPLIQIVGDKLWEASIFNSAGHDYESLGEKETGLEYYKQALRIFREIGYPKGEAGSLSQIGESYYASGKKQEALSYFQQALSVIRVLADQRLESYVLRNIGAVYDSLGDQRKALEYHNQALLLYQKGGDRRGEAYALNSIGSIYLNQSQTEKALDCYNRALSLNKDAGDQFGESATLYNIARAKRGEGNFAASRAHIENAISLIETLRAKVTSPDLRASYFATAQQSYELYIDLLMRQRREGASEALIAEALRVSESARARTLLESMIESRIDIRQGVAPQLLERERQLQRQLSEKSERQASLSVSRQSHREAAVLAEEIERLTTEYQQVGAQVRAASPRYAILTQPQPLGLKEIQQLLDPNTLLLEYALGDERSYLWAIAESSVQAFELPSRANVEKAAESVYELLTAPNRNPAGETELKKQLRIAQAEIEYPKAAAQLSKMLIGPVASLIGSKRLLIVTDGALQYLPFAALPAIRKQDSLDQYSGAKNFSQPSAMNSWTPLIAEHEIINLPSASYLALLRREIENREHAGKTVAVIADPVFNRDDERLKQGGEGLAARAADINSTRDLQRAVERLGLKKERQGIERLRYSAKEAEAILDAAPAGDSMKALGFAANKKMAMSEILKQYRIIHFATHGLINSERPELSGIVLSLIDERGQAQNGFLQLHEIYNLKIAADLVVLSACQTALGKDIRGEGLLGLTRGFMYAGAARVMASLWKVDDAGTAELMGLFYKQMFKNAQRPAAALRAAQLEMLKQGRWQSPYYWAAFTLQGEWR
jgi:CHAT domain-containing protein/tetratricopeptide (TPR) repeat protein